MVLEDDVTVLPCYDDRAHVHRSRWERVWSSVRTEVTALVHRGVHWDLLYLGRNRHGQDEPLPSVETSTPDEREACHPALHVLKAGFSTCAHAYVLTASGIEKLLSLSLHRQVIPVDDLLPALYAEHPRNDMKHRLLHDDRGDKNFMQALGLKEDLVWQLASITDGNEGMRKGAKRGCKRFSDLISPGAGLAIRGGKGCR